LIMTMRTEMCRLNLVRHWSQRQYGLYGHGLMSVAAQQEI